MSKRHSEQFKQEAVAYAITANISFFIYGSERCRQLERFGSL